MVRPEDWNRLPPPDYHLRIGLMAGAIAFAVFPLLIMVVGTVSSGVRSEGFAVVFIVVMVILIILCALRLAWLIKKG